MNVKGKNKKNQVVVANIFEQQELIAKAEAIKTQLMASTWHELEINGKFDKNDKLSFINDDMLILGCDIGSETHYIRAIDIRGRELSKSAFAFENHSEGFQNALDWATKIAAINEKTQIVTNILEISGVGEHILSGILAEMGDISRFDDVKEIQKLAGMGLVACSSGKHEGKTKISHRGRKRLRYWLFQAAKSAVAHAAEFKELHTYLLSIYFTIAGTKHHYGHEYFEPKMEVKLIKEPDNEFDKEAIKVEMDGLGLVGYVANSPYTVQGESMSAGRLYDRIGDTAVGVVRYVLPQGVLCELVLEKAEDEINGGNK